VEKRRTAKPNASAQTSERERTERVGAAGGGGSTGMKRRWAVSRVWQRFRAKEERRRGG